MPKFKKEKRGEGKEEALQEMAEARETGKDRASVCPATFSKLRTGCPAASFDCPPIHPYTPRPCGASSGSLLLPATSAHLDTVFIRTGLLTLIFYLREVGPENQNDD